MPHPLLFGRTILFSVVSLCRLPSRVEDFHFAHNNLQRVFYARFSVMDIHVQQPD